MANPEDPKEQLTGQTPTWFNPPKEIPWERDENSKGSEMKQILIAPETELIYFCRSDKDFQKKYAR